jgi:hypothetical protein
MGKVLLDSRILAQGLKWIVPSIKNVPFLAAVFRDLRFSQLRWEMEFVLEYYTVSTGRQLLL